MECSRSMIAAALLGPLLVGGLARAGAHPEWGWLPGDAGHETLEQRIESPPGFVRERLPAGGFASWLRRLPLEPDGAPVLLHTGRRKPRQDVHAAVLALETGDRDLQQCADTVIRLRAEYLYARGRLDALHFRFTSGDEIPFTRWARGERPRVVGREVRWSSGHAMGTGRQQLRAYLDTIFTYAGTASLVRELRPVGNGALRVGDVFIQGGFPGHAVLVVDAASHPVSGARVFLLVQGFMPAQSAHVLKNPASPSGSAWFDADFGEVLHTPEWSFQAGDLHRFR
jgi:hypothetical protein